MLIYIPSNGATPWMWGAMIHADTGYSRYGTWSGFVGTLTTAGPLPWRIGARANGYKGTFALVCPD